MIFLINRGKKMKKQSRETVKVRNEKKKIANDEF